MKKYILIFLINNLQYFSNTSTPINIYDDEEIDYEKIYNNQEKLFNDDGNLLQHNYLQSEDKTHPDPSKKDNKKSNNQEKLFNDNGNLLQHNYLQSEDKTHPDPSKKDNKKSNKIFIICLLVIIAFAIIIYNIENIMALLGFKKSIDPNPNNIAQNIDNDLKKKVDLIIKSKPVNEHEKREKLLKEIMRNHIQNKILFIIESSPKNDGKFQYIRLEDYEQRKQNDDFNNELLTLIKDNIIEYLKTQKENDYSALIQSINENQSDELIKNIYYSQYYNYSFDNKIFLTESIKKIPMINIDNQNKIILNMQDSNCLINTKDIETIFKFDNQWHSQSVKQNIEKFSEHFIFFSMYYKSQIINKQIEVINIIHKYFQNADNIINLKQQINGQKNEEIINRSNPLIIDNIPFYINKENNSEIEFYFYEMYNNKFIFKNFITIDFNFENNTIKYPIYYGNSYKLQKYQNTFRIYEKINPDLNYNFFVGDEVLNLNESIIEMKNALSINLSEKNITLHSSRQTITIDKIIS